jgi:purine-binding chemotaxis protein CheW
MMFDMKVMAPVSAEQLSLAVFYVAEGLYGIDIMKIKEVIYSHPYKVRTVPHAPPMIEGVIELRGVVVPVMDLRERLELGVSLEARATSKYVVVSVSGKILALRVDRILGEVRISPESVRPSPALLDGGWQHATKFFGGVARVDEGLIFVLNLDGLAELGGELATSSGRRASGGKGPS